MKDKAPGSTQHFQRTITDLFLLSAHIQGENVTLVLQSAGAEKGCQNETMFKPYKCETPVV